MDLGGYILEERGYIDLKGWAFFLVSIIINRFLIVIQN
jgi:hypothetical protein